MKRPLAGALLAATAFSLSTLGAVGAAHAETSPPPAAASGATGPGVTPIGATGTQVTFECTHPDDNTLFSVAQINFVRQTPIIGSPSSNKSFTQSADISTIDAFANDANSTYSGPGPNLVDSTATIASIEIKLYGNVTDALTPPPVIFDQTIFNWDGTFHFAPKQNHVSYGTMTVHWTKAGVAQDDEILACSVPGDGRGFATDHGPNYG